MVTYDGVMSRRPTVRTWGQRAQEGEKTMPQTVAQVRTMRNGSAALGWTGSHAIAIDRTVAGGGLGIGFSGGDLLLLAIGGCYCNDLYREASKLGIVVRSVSVEVGADWGGD